MMNNNKRIVWLDAVKGIGILSIMLVHMVALPFDTKYIATGYVAMFFVISGLTFAVHKGVVQSIRSKCSRLLIPYFFYCISIVLIVFAFSLVSGKDYDIVQNLLGVIYSRRSWVANDIIPEESLLLRGGCSPLWFLTSLFTSLLLVYLWHALRRSRYLLVIYALLAVGGSMLPVLLPWSIDVAPLGALIIITGIQFRQQLCCATYDKWFPVVFISYMVLCYVNGAGNMSIRCYGDHSALSIPLFFIIAIGEYWLLSVFCRWTESTLFTKSMAYLGRSSLRLMCIHMFVWVIVKDMIQSRIGDEWHYPLVVLALCIVLVANHFIEKIREKVRPFEN